MTFGKHAWCYLTNDIFQTLTTKVYAKVRLMWTDHTMNMQREQSLICTFPNMGAYVQFCNKGSAFYIDTLKLLREDNGSRHWFDTRYDPIDPLSATVAYQVTEAEANANLIAVHPLATFDFVTDGISSAGFYKWTLRDKATQLPVHILVWISCELNSMPHDAILLKFIKAAYPGRFKQGFDTFDDGGNSEDQETVLMNAEHNSGADMEALRDQLCSETTVKELWLKKPCLMYNESSPTSTVWCVNDPSDKNKGRRENVFASGMCALCGKLKRLQVSTPPATEQAPIHS
jgi:hypothetical protein